MNMKKNILKMMLLSSMFLGGSFLWGSEEEVVALKNEVDAVPNQEAPEEASQIATEIMEQIMPIIAEEPISIIPVDADAIAAEGYLPNTVHIYTKQRIVVAVNKTDEQSGTLTLYTFPLVDKDLNIIGNHGVIGQDFSFTGETENEGTRFFGISSKVPEELTANLNSSFFSPLLRDESTVAMNSRPYIYSSNGTFSLDVIKNIWCGVKTPDQDGPVRETVEKIKDMFIGLISSTDETDSSQELIEEGRESIPEAKTQLEQRLEELSSFNREQRIAEIEHELTVMLGNKGLTDVLSAEVQTALFEHEVQKLDQYIESETQKTQAAIERLDAQMAYLEAKASGTEAIDALIAANSPLQPVEYSCDVFIDNEYFGRFENGQLKGMNPAKFTKSFADIINSLEKTEGFGARFLTELQTSLKEHPIKAALSVLSLIELIATGQFSKIYTYIRNIMVNCRTAKSADPWQQLRIRASYSLFSPIILPSLINAILNK